VTSHDEFRSRVDEALLDESAEDLYEYAPCGYLSTLPDGTIARANHRFIEWTGISREALLAGSKFQILLTVGSRIYLRNALRPVVAHAGRRE